MWRRTTNCRITQRLKVSMFEFLVISFRAINKTNKNSYLIKIFLNVNFLRRCFMDLMSHEKEILRESPERIEAFNTYLKVLEECFPSKSKNPSQGEIYS